MDKDYLIKLTLAVYRVTELFPSREPLKVSIREKANRILADSVLIFSKNPVNLAKEQKNKLSEQILGNIEILQGYFEVAQAQEWLREPNFLVLKGEYAKMGQEISKKPQKKHNKPIEQSTETAENSSPLLGKERCRRILEVLKQREKAQIWEFKKIFPQVTKRTLRRDFGFLLTRGLVERVGDGKWTFYKLKQAIVRPTDGSRTQILS